MHRGAILAIVFLLAPFLTSADVCPSLSLGSTGASVTAVQKVLYDAYEGFPTPTGYFGSLTQTALKQWQGEHGFESVGFVGPKTAAAMGLCTATVSTNTALPTNVSGTSTTSSSPYVITRTLSRGMSGNDVVTLQQFLISQQLLSADSATGFFGPLTEAAVRAFQSQKGIASSGTPSTTGYGAVGPKTRAAIVAKPAVTQTNTPSTVTVNTNTPNASTAPAAAPATQSIPSGTTTTGPPSSTATPSSTVGTSNTSAPAGGPGAEYTPNTCSLNGISIPSGGTLSAYQAASVAATQSCASQIRTCTNGSLSGTYQFASCSVASSTNPVTVSLTADDKEGAIEIASGAGYTLKWASANATSCAASTYSVNGAAASAWGIKANASVTYPTTLPVNAVSYTISCTGAGGSSAKKTVTVSAKAQTTTPGIYDKDGYLIIPAKSIFPSKYSILPNGVTYTDTVPDTLDLAFRAGQFLRSEVATAITTHYNPTLGRNLPFFSVPAHAIFQGFVNGEDSSSQGQGSFQARWCADNALVGPKFPCLWPDPGDWGLEMIAMTKAREMTADDRDDSAGTLSGQYTMLTNLYDITAWQTVQAYTGANVLRPQKIASTDSAYGTATESPLTGSTFAMEALLAYLPDQPGNTLLQTAIQAYVQMHKDYLSTSQTGGGTFSYFYNIPLANWAGGEQGVTPVYPVFVQGRASYALLSVYKQTANATALSIANSLMNFLQNWVAPYSGKNLLSSAGPFTDHIYSQEQGIFALIADAEVHKQRGDTATATAEFAQADRMFRYIITATNAGVIGNFAESGTSGEMIRIAIKLTENGTGSYYDKAEYWTRNQLAEVQLGVNSQIGWNTSMGGMFWSDATHPFAIPTNNKNYRYNVDGSANAMIAMSDVWNHIVTTKGSVAHVNFLLNGASKYVTVRSDLPYRGQIEAQTAQSLDGINALAVRIPDWTDHTYAAVSITARDAQGERTLTGGTEAGWMFIGSYAYIYNAKPNTAYTVHFPIKIYTATVYQMRPPEIFWYESSVPSSSGPAVVTTYTGTFRGYELVSATPAVSYAGIALYQRQSLAALPAGDATPPKKTVQRFIHNGTSSSIPVVLPSTARAIVLLNADSKSSLVINKGDTYTLSYSSANAVSCSLSWVNGPGGTYVAGSPIHIAQNTSLSFPKGGFIGTYTFTCTGSDGTPVSKSVKIDLATDLTTSIPSASVTINSKEGTIHVLAGSAYTVAWNSSNVSSCSSSTFTADGTTRPWSISPNVSASFPTTLSVSSLTYTISCINNSGQSLSKSVTVTSL